jgi:catechol 2,3-dioxygenase-like lactoylglutathione lyase family enzyme
MTQIPTKREAAIRLSGVHHTARPTWKLKETVEFYQDVLGLRLMHAISAKGWGPDGHPDFLHFFFDSGQGSLIAFFYYLGLEPQPFESGPDAWLFNAVHTAWRVETEDELVAWQRKLDSKGIQVQRIRHEIIDSIYFIDPNDYMVEISWQVREIEAPDQLDASLTLEAAIALETATGKRVEAIEAIWRRKGEMLTAKLGDER